MVYPADAKLKQVFLDKRDLSLKKGGYLIGWLLTYYYKSNSSCDDRSELYRIRWISIFKKNQYI